jgi:replicative DNA helicase
VAASIELQLLSKLVETGDYRTLQQQKITEHFFTSAESKEILRFISRHHGNTNTYGSVPSRQILRRRFPAFAFTQSPDDLPTLCAFLKDTYLTRQLHLLIDELGMQAAQNPHDALEVLRQASLTLSAQHEQDNDMLISDAHDGLLEEYRQVVECGGITGIPFPWKVLNDDTQGLHGQDFVVLYGRPKSMKTWVGLKIGMHAYVEGRQRVLIYSLEMAPKHLMRRCAAILSGVGYGKVKKGQLDRSEYERFFGALKAIKENEANDDGTHSSLLITGKGGRNKGGVSSLHAKIEEFRPNLVIVDGMYLMRDDRQGTANNDWKSMRNISQDLKETATVFNVPLIGITQAKRESKKDKESSKEADLDEIAYADAIGQDCDLAIRVKRQRDKDTNEPELMLQFPGTREGMLEAFVIHGNPAINFDYKRAVMSEEHQQQQEEDKPRSKRNGKGKTDTRSQFVGFGTGKASWTKPNIKTYNTVDSEKQGTPY